LVRSARDLQQACEDAARQSDLLAERRRPPIAIDHRVTAKRWRALADRASAAASAWSDNAAPPPSAAAAVRAAAGSFPDGADAAEGHPDLADVLDNTTLQGLFTIGLRLDATLPLTEGEVRVRLEQTVRDVDECIQGVMQVALGMGNRHG